MSRSQTGRKVFVTNMGFHDFTKAERFGDLLPITENKVDLYHTDRLNASIEQALADMEPEDYILVSGNPFITALVVIHVLNEFSRLRLLYWDPLYQDYILRETER